jgi:hypothetical protein
LIICLLFPIIILIYFHKFLIGDRSGDSGGQRNRLVLSLSK